MTAKPGETSQERSISLLLLPSLSDHPNLSEIPSWVHLQCDEILAHYPGTALRIETKAVPDHVYSGIVEIFDAPITCTESLPALLERLEPSGFVLIACPGSTPEMLTLGDALIQHGFETPVVDREVLEISDQNTSETNHEPLANAISQSSPELQKYTEYLFAMAFKPSIQKLAQTSLKHGRGHISLDSLKAMLKQQGYEEGKPTC